MAIGMSVPGAGATSLMDSFSLGGQIADETEEQRRKRLLARDAALGQPAGASSLTAGFGDLIGR